MKQLVDKTTAYETTVNEVTLDEKTVDETTPNETTVLVDETTDDTKQLIN